MWSTSAHDKISNEGMHNAWRADIGLISVMADIEGWNAGIASKEKMSYWTKTRRKIRSTRWTRGRRKVFANQHSTFAALIICTFSKMTRLAAQEKEEEQEDSISLTTRPSLSLPHPPTTSRPKTEFPRIFGSTPALRRHGKNTKKVELGSGASSHCHTIKNWLRQALLRRIFHSTRSHFSEMHLIDTGFFCLDWPESQCPLTVLD